MKINNSYYKDDLYGPEKRKPHNGASPEDGKTVQTAQKD